MSNSFTPLPADLPENWSSGQIVSPSGVEVGLTKQHGYNYLNKMVNDAQSAINQLYNIVGPWAPKIYGAQWDGTSTTKWVRTDDASNFSDPIPYVSGATEYGSPFDTILPWAGMVKSVRAGGVMVSIPKFYYSLTQQGPGMEIKISSAPFSGSYVSPMHMDRGDGKGERDVAYVGRYHCGDGNWKSETGVLPKENVTREMARTEIHNLGSSIWQGDFMMRFTLWLLYIVEFADWNSQAAIGNGCGSGASVQNMGYTDSMPYHTGTTQSSRDTYGLGTQYRNIEGLWDNLYDWCDGCYNNTLGFNIIKNPAQFSDNEGGTTAAFPAFSQTGYPNALTVETAVGFPIFYPDSVSMVSDIMSTCDYWSFFPNMPCIYVGGNLTHNDYNGLFYFHSSAALGGAGSRLQELP